MNYIAHNVLTELTYLYKQMYNKKKPVKTLDNNDLFTEATYG